MQNALIDSGPLIALFDKNDKYHPFVLSFLKEFKGALITSWPVITEVCHLLDFNQETQLDFLRWIYAGGVEVKNLPLRSFERIIELVHRYSSLPMDLADASLIYLAEDEGIQNVVSLDTDYYVYRTKKKKALNNLLSVYR